MLSFIQRILQFSSSSSSDSNSSRKRKRSSAFTTEHATSSEIEDLRTTIPENDFDPYLGASTCSADREQTISACLGLDGQATQRDLSSKRLKHSETENEDEHGNESVLALSQSGNANGNYRLSTISERREEEMEENEYQNENENKNGEEAGQCTHNEKRRGDDDDDGGSGDEEMVDVDLGLQIHPQTQTSRRIESSDGGMVVDRDVWRWKGGSIMQR